MDKHEKLNIIDSIMEYKHISHMHINMYLRNVNHKFYRGENKDL